MDSPIVRHNIFKVLEHQFKLSTSALCPKVTPFPTANLFLITWHLVILPVSLDYTFQLLKLAITSLSSKLLITESPHVHVVSWSLTLTGAALQYTLFSRRL